MRTRTPPRSNATILFTGATIPRYGPDGVVASIILFVVDTPSPSSACRLSELLKREIVILDGANGTFLQSQGFHSFPYDLANLESPELVLAAHRAYVEAGADMIETNTFSSNAIKMGATGANIHEVNMAGAKLAVEAAAGRAVVLGAIGPCGKTLEPIGTLSRELALAAFREQASALTEGGVDGFILETFADLDEVRIAVRAIREFSNLPILVSKAFVEDGEALAEGLPHRVGEELSEMDIAAIGANCVVGPQRMVDIVRQLAESTTKPVIALPTPGLPQRAKGAIVYDTSPEYFAKACIRLAEEGARIIGGCCGTTPEHIRMLSEALKARPIKRAVRRAASKGEVSPAAELEQTPRTSLGESLGKRFVVAVELDLPRGLNIKKVLNGAQALKEKGVHIIDISDGARARLRMNPLSVGKLVQDEVGIEVMMHFACRDRNLLAVQADLLGAHALGVRNILAVTGDPANIGDYPSATSVYDVDSIGLVRIMSRFNEGVDLAGYSVGVRCGFTIAVAYNPLAQDQSEEDDRLRRKADAGAHMVYTQPIFDKKVAENAAEMCREVGLPLFLGVLPLRSARHAEFMHNEVPGITIPQALRDAITGAADDASALEIGVAEAQSLAVFAQEISSGLYLMPPFGNHEIAERVVSVLKLD